MSLQPQPEMGQDDLEQLRSLELPTHLDEASQAGLKKVVARASVPPEVTDACSIALRRMGGVDRSVAVTSAARREGRTTVAIGLAAASALQHNRSTILLDLDLERGAIAKQTALQASPGVTELLYHHASLDDCLQKTSDQLAIITSGAPRETAGILARLESLSDLIEELLLRCEVLIADMPPLSSGVIAASMADLFESVALVVRAGRVSVPHIEKSVSVLTQRPFVILNAEAAPRSSRIRRPFQRLLP